MKDSNENIESAEQRLLWFKEYEKVKNVPAVCAKFGISRKTFYKWQRRYKKAEFSLESLSDQSRRPHTNPRATPEHVIKRLRELREQTGFGQKRLQLYLSIWYGIDLAENTIWKLLRRSGVDMEVTKKNKRKVKPSDPLFPGDRVILFIRTFEKPINKKKYFLYEAVDECTHLRIAKIYGSHSTLSALDFVQQILVTFPFPVRYLHTPLDNVFTSVSTARSKTHAFTLNLRKLGIKHFVPTKRQTASPTYNEKIKKFYSPKEFLKFNFNALHDAELLLRRYLTDYNNNQPRKEIGLKTPLSKLKNFAQFKEIERFETL
ncbi:MAG: transposase [Bacteroidetes bacterium]|nr:transposase [Bacteroidota bacterium]